MLILGYDYLDFLEEEIHIEDIPEIIGGECTEAGDYFLNNIGPWNKTKEDILFIKNSISEENEEERNENVNSADL